MSEALLSRLAVTVLDHVSKKNLPMEIFISAAKVKLRINSALRENIPFN